MSIKPPDLLNRLPSVSELLDKPPVRAIVDRWNRSMVAGRLKSFLDEVRTDFERRAGELPSIRELAERAAKYVVSRQQHSLGIAINATGQLGGTMWASSPMPELALENLVSLGREYSPSEKAIDYRPSAALESVLCRLTRAQAAIAVHNYASAVWIALAALARDREVLVSRAEVGGIDGETSLTRLAAAAGALLQEVGSANCTSAGDFEAAVTGRSSVLLALSTDSYRLIGETTMPSLDELVSVARQRKLCLIDALEGAPLVEPPVALHGQKRSAAASIERGANVVILRGDGLVGGPACGILLGNREFIDQIASHPLYPLIRLDALRTSGVLATAECYDSPARGSDSVPIWQCLATSIENLQNRAERLAAQLSAVPGVASATAVELRSPLFAAPVEGGWPSYGVALTPSTGDVQALGARLRGARTPIVGREEQGRLVLDLRTVLPRQDKTIVDVLVG